MPAALWGQTEGRLENQLILNERQNKGQGGRARRPPSPSRIKAQGRAGWSSKQSATETMKEGAVHVCELKAGHPPAVKAGGMRVSKKQGNEENVTPEKMAKKSSSEKPSSAVNLTKMQAMNFLAGALEKLSHELPAEAAQLAHQKPRPTVEKVVLNKRLYFIQQPRRC
ncbi:death-associated protein-like 1 isoform X2 [Bufo bufo]|uniref:death-associated protein-like 1 isoform X2 n=1 Tax=Bufo bufo TaxID=8384 RepID=UPI001ABE1C13|nr:death-associated protein-like 1 isoform X2 [Bufo bufo]